MELLANVHPFDVLLVHQQPHHLHLVGRVLLVERAQLPLLRDLAWDAVPAVRVAELGGVHWAVACAHGARAGSRVHEHAMLDAFIGGPEGLVTAGVAAAAVAVAECVCAPAVLNAAAGDTDTVRTASIEGTPGVTRAPTGGSYRIDTAAGVGAPGGR